MHSHQGGWKPEAVEVAAARANATFARRSTRAFPKRISRVNRMIQPRHTPGAPRQRTHCAAATRPVMFYPQEESL